MCLIFFSLNNHANYKLIIAANRDEFYHRSTASAGFWKDHPEVVGGRDLEAQGTWMAMNTAGKIAMVTNYRDPQHIRAHAPTRGALVSNYLTENVEAENYLNAIAPVASEYNGFNLLLGTVDELWYFSNYKEGMEQVAPGFYGLSNHLLETPWPKVAEGKKILSPIFAQTKANIQQVLDAMHNQALAPDDKLPRTGLPLARERALSAMFISTENYGTRCSTIILVDRDNNVEFVERVYKLTTMDYEEQSFQFPII